MQAALVFAYFDLESTKGKYVLSKAPRLCKAQYVKC